MLTDQMTAADKSGLKSGEAAVSVLRPAAIFSDGMVLQRGRLIPVWGYASPRERVECTLGDSRAVTFAGEDGYFFLKLSPLEAAAGLEMILSCQGSCCRIKDVAVGEVFLIAGQSNMEYDLTNVKEAPAPCNGVLRTFRVKPGAFPGRAGDVTGVWQESSQPKGFSAIGYFFGAAVCRELGVPVGLVNVSRGGVGAETFISEYRLSQDPFYGKMLAEYEAARFLPENNPETSGSAIANSGRLVRRIRDCDPEIPALSDELKDWILPSYDDTQWQTQYLPDSWSLAGHLHTGVFLYRKKVTIPSHWQGKKLLLSPGICDRADECFVNGTLVGKTGKPNSLSHWNTVRRYEVPEELTQNGQLVIGIKVAAFCSICTYGGLVGPREEMFLACGEEKIPLDGPWQLAEAADTGKEVMENMVKTGAGEVKSFHALYDNCLLPLENLTVNSVLWYQGEANTLSCPEQYDGLQRGVIRTFRDLFKDPDLPVTVFLLPGFQEERLYSPFSTWALIRDSQLRVTFEETGEVPVNLCDCGDKDDIHPPEKRIPGERAAACVLARMRGEIPPQGARLTGGCREGKKVILSFDTGGAALADFEGPSGLAGVDACGEAVPLDAVVCGADKISVTLLDKEIAAIAYGWCENPGIGRLRSTNGLPVFPFKLNI